jgi:hypothetical protein
MFFLGSLGPMISIKEQEWKFCMGSLEPLGATQAGRGIGIDSGQLVGRRSSAISERSHGCLHDGVTASVTVLSFVIHSRSRDDKSTKVELS